MTTVEEWIDKVSATLLFLTFPLVMTGGSAITNQPTPNAMVEGTPFTIAEMATLLVGVGFGCFVLGILTILLLLVLPRRLLKWEPTLPTIQVEW